MKKILIFGATGSVGAYLVDHCINNMDEEFEIFAISKRETSFFEKKYGIQYISVDISKKEDFERLPRTNIHTIVFLAGILPAYMEGYTPSDYFSINTIGGLNALEYAASVDCNKFIYTQTISDLSGYFGETKELCPYMKRNIKMNTDHTLYVISKCAVVDMMEHYFEKYGLNIYTLRLPNIYMYTKNMVFHVDGKAKFIAYLNLIEKVKRGESVEIWGDPQRGKDIVYVKDFCQMVEKVILTDKKKGLYNVGTGVETSLEEQIRGIVEVFSSNIDEIVVSYRPELPSNPEYIMNIENARTELGYSPRFLYRDLLIDLKEEMEKDRFSELTKSFVN